MHGWLSLPQNGFIQIKPENNDGAKFLVISPPPPPDQWTKLNVFYMQTTRWCNNKTLPGTLSKACSQSNSVKAQTFPDSATWKPARAVLLGGSCCFLWDCLRFHAVHQVRLVNGSVILFYQQLPNISWHKIMGDDMRAYACDVLS